MARNTGATPPGTGDMLYETCATLRGIEKRLMKVYTDRGYREVSTSLFEYYDTFLMAGTLTQDRMCVLTDSEGFLNVLRPDSTTPIARIAAKRLSDEPLPLRLCYNQYVFRREAGGGRNIVIPQSGIELLGVSGLKADTDAVITAITALESLELAGFKLELGHVGIFKQLTSRIPFESGDLERIRLDVQNKNYAALCDTLDYYKADYPEDCAAINMLPRLFGGRKVFEEAREIIKDEGALEILDSLETLLIKLESISPDTVIVDLGLVQHIDYYSGLVFKGYIEGTGEAALSGGRYDGLTQSFSADLPAVGFAIGLDVVLNALERAGRGEIPAPPDALVCYHNGYGKKAYDFLARLAASGVRCEMGLFDDYEKNLSLACERGILKLYIIGEEIEERRTDL